MASIVLAAASPFALALAGTLVILWFGIHHGFKPLRQLSKDVAGRDIQELEPLAWDNAPEEVKPLVAEINRLLMRVSQVLQRERRFTGDAAHELRTPLTGIKTQLQVASLTQGKQSNHALEQAARALDRLQDTLEQLLLLARIEGNAAFADASRSSADEITSSALVEVTHKAEEKQIRIAYRNRSSERVAVPAALASAALRNLLDNAVRFSPDRGRIDINCSLDGEWILWRIVDQGPGAPAGELQVLTERFKRTTGNGGSGLGLAIVEAIASRFGGSLRLANSSPQGLEAQLRLPRAH
ncbi:MAG: ATP-binding protein [Haliea sp.]